MALEQIEQDAASLAALKDATNYHALFITGQIEKRNMVEAALTKAVTAITSMSSRVELAEAEIAQLHMKRMALSKQIEDLGPTLQYVDRISEIQEEITGKERYLRQVIAEALAKRKVATAQPTEIKLDAEAIHTEADAEGAKISVTIQNKRLREELEYFNAQLRAIDIKPQVLRVKRENIDKQIKAIDGILESKEVNLNSETEFVNRKQDEVAILRTAISELNRYREEFEALSKVIGIIASVPPVLNIVESTEFMHSDTESEVDA